MFRNFFNESIIDDFWYGVLPKTILNLEKDSTFLENEDLIKQGYRLITGKHGATKGQKIWWKQGFPVIPAADVQATKPQSQPQSQPQEKLWTLAIVVDSRPGLVKHTQVVASRRNDGNFDVMDESGRVIVINKNEIASVIKSIKDGNDKPVQSTDPRSLLKQLEPVAATKEPTTVKKKSALIPDDLISDEQKNIDKQFERVLNSPKQSHMSISALAGSGKTSMLAHLSEKYGKLGQKWLYLVFNNKNKAEAKEKFNPSFVQVETTNSFLGKVLSQNKTNFPQTDRMTKLSDEEGGSKILEKARILMDSSEFAGILSNMGLSPEIDPHQYNNAKTLKSLMKSIQYSIKEQILTLVGLVKSFALDPRNKGNLEQGMNKIFDSYDFDTEVSEVKERVNKYSGHFRNEIIYDLQEILGYDFLTKDYKKEIEDGAKWLLNATMIHGTKQTLQRGRKNYNLGEYRDFNDDLWYSAIHANEIKWPKYDVVLADEVQDFNDAQKIMLQKLHDAGAKIVVVGDKNQSLYRFRGADSKAFENIQKMIAELSHDKNVAHELTKNFRSKKAVIDFANATTHVKNLKLGRNFPDEGVATDKEVKYDDAFSSLKSEKEKTGRVRETAFISRTNEPLVHAALKLLADNVPFVIVGKDIARDLIKHISKIGAKFGLNSGGTVDELENRLDAFHVEEKESHYGKSTKKAYLEGLKEITEALLSSIKAFKAGNENGTISQFQSWLTQRLSGLDVAENEKDLAKYKAKLEKEHPVILTTAHRSKGLEFDRVYILRDDQFPHPKAKRPEDIEQEENARYVARTRAKSDIHVLDLKGQPGYSGK